MKYLPFLLIFLFIHTFGQLKSENVFSQLKTALPEEKGVSSQRLMYIDSIMNKYATDGTTPGGVVLIARKGSIIYRKAFGDKSIFPKREKLTPETIYDMASVTKSVATGTLVMKMVEKGKINLMNDVRRYIPEFVPFVDENGQEHHAQIYHLLTHTSGLPDYINANIIKSKYENPVREDIIREVATVKKERLPGKEFEYSCLGYITLAEILYRVTGKTIDILFEEEIAKPLGLKNSFFLPPQNRYPDIAPTEKTETGVILGRVHDPLASFQGGISGNAGLFSNVDDLAIFMQMMMNGGVYNGVRILGRPTIETMTKPYKFVAFSGRGLGWDSESDYMGQRGDIFTDNCYGHTGFTGTSILAVPNEELFIIILTNRVHEPTNNNILRLRREIANIVASSLE